MGDNADSHELLSVIAAVHHQRIGETFDDGAICFSKPLDSIATGGMGDVDGISDLDVITGIEKCESAKVFPSPYVPELHCPPESRCTVVMRCVLQIHFHLISFDFFLKLGHSRQ